MIKHISRSPNYKWIVFGAVGLGSITNVTHHGGVAIALPTIAQDLALSLTTVQWIILAESLTISVMLLPMGRLADIAGRKLIYLMGILLFGGMALLSGSSPWFSGLLGISSPILLMIVFRIFQGLGASMTQASGMAMVTSVFPDKERGKGLGAHGSVIGTGGVIGPILGGILITYISWHWVFWINVPLCLVAFVAGTTLLDSEQFSAESKGKGSRRYDWIGASLSTAFLLSFLLTLSNGSHLGFSSPPILAGLLVCLSTLMLFIWYESKTDAPLLDLSLFKDRVFSIGIGSNYVSFLGVSSFRFIIPFYLQAALNFTPAQVAYILIPNAVSRIILGPLSGHFSDQIGRRVFTTVGLALCGSGLYMMSLMNAQTSVSYVLLSILAFSCGSGLFMSPNSAGIFGAARGNNHGVVSALVNLSRNSANVSGIAIATAIVATTMIAGGFSSDVDAVMEAQSGSSLLNLFISGTKTVYILMGTLQIVSSIAHLFTNPVTKSG